MTRRTLNPTRRTAGLAVSAVAAATLLTGCGQLINPYTTELQYDPADGVTAQAGDLKASDLFIVTGKDGGSGSFSGLVSNPSDSDRTLTVEVDGSSAQVKVPAHQSVRLDGKPNGNDPATTSPVKTSLGSVKPGAEITVTLTSNPGGSTQVKVPVLLNQPPYGTTKLKDAEVADGHASE